MNALSSATRRAHAFVAFVVVMLTASAAFACPVCGGAKAENDWAFGVTTLILSVMPPLFFGGIIAFFVRAHRKAQREEASNISTPAE